MSGSLRGFDAFLNKVKSDIVDQVASETHRLVHELLEAVDDLSPVKTGRYRANWTAARGRAMRRDLPEGTYGAPAIDSSAALVRTLGLFVLNNSTPYAQPIEDGSSEQAPVGVAALAIHAVLARRRRGI